MNSIIKFLKKLLPAREVKVVYDYKYLIHFHNEAWTEEERKIFQETAHIHLKVIKDKYKAILAYSNDHRAAEADLKKWETNKLIQVGGVKALEELIAFYSDIITPPKKKEEKESATPVW